ncbi:MAG: amino acid adenylation domain-containing protein, partial [Coleofasciculus sp. Co-bin14]|nr:amino acid adenylation domain-containing protein [Coleofasciculus sp. Co-bin14]
AQGNGQKSLEYSQPSVVVTVLDNVSGIKDGNQWLAEFKQQNSEFIDNLDLHVLLLQQEQGISGIFEYNANLFELDTIERLSGHFQVLLEAMANDLDSTIAQLPLLTQPEQQQLLVEWKSASVNYPQIPIYQHIEAHAVQSPNASAVRFKEQHLTYAQLNQQANQLAHYLKSVGVKADDRVAVCVQPSLEIAVALLGIFKAGGVYVPLDSTHPQERLTAILEDTQANVLLTQAQLLPNLPAIIQHTLWLDKDWETIQQFPAHNPENEVLLDQTAYIIYTSGTTGKPKGVMASHRNLVNYILATQERFGFNQHDVMPVVARFTFSIAMFELLSPLAAGGTLVVLERDHILDFKRLTQTLEQLTMLHTVPSLMQKLLTYIKDNGLDMQKFQGIKHVFTGGDIVAPDLLEKLKNVFQNAKVYVLYGCSEVSSLCCSYPVPRDQIVTKSRVGKPFNNVYVRLYDPHQNLVPIGIPGEIYVSGAGVTKGYLHRDDLTQEKFVTIDGQQFYRTGDLGRFSADGNIEFLGRADFQVKLRGIRIELGEIESTLRQAPGVREGVVVARELVSGEQGLVAYVVLEQIQNSAIEDIRSVLQAKLPDYMVPAAFVVLEAMPLNPNQKVDRRALPMPTPENLAGLKAIVPPRNDWERQVIEIWENVLNVQPIGIQNDFFELGGSSLLAVEMFAQIEKKFGKQFPLSILLTAPTIAQLANLLGQSEQAQLRESLVLLREGSTKPPVFLIHDGDGETLLCRALANSLDPEVPVYGVQPYSNDRCPILHTRFSDMVDYYIQQIRKVQQQGPYFLAGLCAGGILAFEIARQLQIQGQPIKMVAIIDAADVEATKRAGYVSNKRLSSFANVFNENKTLKQHEQLLYILNQVRKKVTNLIAYEFQKQFETIRAHIQLTLFRYCLDKGLSVPKFLQGIPVRKILTWAQRKYVPQGVFDGEVVLFRATQKSSVFDGTAIDDTPYVELYNDPLLGWGKRVTKEVQVYDVPGGHSSMLQEPNVQVMAQQMQAYIDAALSAESASVLEVATKCAA